MHLPASTSASMPTYGKRSHTAPLFAKPQWLKSNADRGKTIKSLNIYCLARIFNFLDYLDLTSCRLVCSFWKESVDYHLKGRRAFAFNNKLNGLRITQPTSSLLSTARPSLPVLAYCRQCCQLNTRPETIDHHQPATELKCHNCTTTLCQPQQDACVQMKINNANMINVQVLEHILTKLPNLTKITFAQGYRYGRHGQQTCLDVHGAHIVSLTQRHCPHLTHIDLSNCTGLVIEDFEQLAACYGSQLQSLNVSGCHIDEACLRVIVKKLCNLRHLNVCNNFCHLQGACFEWLSHKIESLVVDYNQNVRSLDGVMQGKGRNIVQLAVNVGFCFNPTLPYKLIGFNFQSLISLKITFKSFGKRKPKTFENLAELNLLEELHLVEEIDDFDSESFLDDESILTILGSCGKNLRELVLHAGFSLFSDFDNFSDVCIGHIDKLCPLLEVLSLKGASITDVSLEAIGKLNYASSVELIDLKYITKQGINNLMRAFKRIETRQLQQVYEATGIDLKVRPGGPQIANVTR